MNTVLLSTPAAALVMTKHEKSDLYPDELCDQHESLPAGPIRNQVDPDFIIHQ